MAEFSTIPEEQAPPRPSTVRRLQDRMREYDAFIGQVKPGQVGRLEPEDGETARAVSYRISRAGKRVGTIVQTWMVDDIVYFRLADSQ